LNLTIKGFSPVTLFEEFFKSPAKRSISTYTENAETQSKFLSCLEEKMEEIFRHLEFAPEVENALSQHVNCLATLWPHLASLKTFRTCLACAMFTPEKVFQCGHAVCNVCIRRHGTPSRGQKHSFIIANCPLCGFLQPQGQRLFRLIPPTAGIRALCIDGGGVKGVIPLEILKHLQTTLSHLDSPINEFFDYICGTSAGT
jgi:hypothetical protein